jgi:prepilin-type N-terminal cleavage/methylation domain-containing protein
MRRSGYTLLEIILALAIAVLLMAALYVAVDVQLRFAQSGRDRVEQSTVARGIFGRMRTDAASALSLSDPGRFRTQSSSSTPAPSTPTTGTGTADSTATTDDGTAVSDDPVVLSLGVDGTSDALHLYLSRTPRELLNATDNPPIVSDLRRVSYWLVPDAGDGQGGLARQEVKVISSTEATTLPPGLGNDAQFVFATEVKSLMFEYYDDQSQSWESEWHSTDLGADNKTPKGSPRAVRVTVGLAPPDNPTQVTTYTQVIAFPNANGSTPLQQTNPSSSTGGGGTSP